LTQVSQTLAQAMQRQAPTGAGGGPRAGGPPAGEVVDAEFEDTDERKAS
jgi:hypothetical protein